MKMPGDSKAPKRGPIPAGVEVPVSASSVSRYLKAEGWSLATRSGDYGLRVTRQCSAGTVSVFAHCGLEKTAERYIKKVAEDLTRKGYRIEVGVRSIEVLKSPAKTTTIQVSSLRPFSDVAAFTDAMVVTHQQPVQADVKVEVVKNRKNSFGKPYSRDQDTDGSQH